MAFGLALATEILQALGQRIRAQRLAQERPQRRRKRSANDGVQHAEGGEAHETSDHSLLWLE